MRTRAASPQAAIQVNPFQQARNDPDRQVAGPLPEHLARLGGQT